MNNAKRASRCLTPSLSTYNRANDDAALATTAAGSESAPFDSRARARAEPTTSWTSAPTMATSAASQRARRAGLAYSRLTCFFCFFLFLEKFVLSFFFFVNAILFFDSAPIKK